MAGSARILGIAVRTARRGPMRELSAARAAENGGVEGDLDVPPSRGVTLLDVDAWQAALQQLGDELPWHTRRANVLVTGLRLASLAGRKIRLGEVRLHIEGETKPCALMDELHPGLWDALKPDFRGGVHGRVERGGSFAVGDVIELL